jgi:hypothetical protein
VFRVAKGKVAVAKLTSLGRSVLEWSDVLRAVPGSKTRVWLIGRYKSMGFDAESFGRKSGRVAMAGALTATEDWLELEQPRNVLARARIRDLRRRLELELWP